MASRVKGITIEINGDTTGLSKSLSGVNKELNAAKTELKDVEKLLKLDPGNVELLEQKQKNLSEQIELTTKKLDALKSAEKQVQAQFEKGDISEKQYNALKREIIATETSLKDLQEKAEDSKKALKDAGEKGSDAFKKLKKEADKSGDSIENIANKATAAGEKLKGVSTAAAGAFAGAAALIGATAEESADLAKLETNAKSAGVGMEYLDEAMRRLYVVTQETDSNIEGLSNLMQAGFTDTGLLNAVELLSGAVIQFPDTLKFESLADSLQETIKTGAATGQFAELLDRLGIGTEKFNKRLEKTKNESKRLDLALQTLSKAGLSSTTEEYFKANKSLTSMLMSQSDLKQATVEFADALRPIAAELMPMLVNLLKIATDFISQMDSETLLLITGLLGFTAVLSPLLIIIGQTITAIQGISTALTALSANPTVLMVAAIAAIVAALVMLEQKTKIFSKTFTAIWQGIKKVIEKISNFFISIFTEKIPAALNKLKDFFKKIWDSIVAVMKAPVNMIIKMLNSIISGINKVFSWANSLKLPDFLGGASLGFNFKPLEKIPLLAKGGVLTSGTAIVGEAGPEALTVKNGKAIVQPLGGGAALSAAGNNYYFNVNANDLQSVADFWRVAQSATRLGRMK